MMYKLHSRLSVNVGQTHNVSTLNQYDRKGQIGQKKHILNMMVEKKKHIQQTNKPNEPASVDHNLIQKTELDLGHLPKGRFQMGWMKAA